MSAFGQRSAARRSHAGAPAISLVALALLSGVFGCSGKSSTKPAPSPAPSLEVFSSGVFSGTDLVHVYVHTFTHDGTWGYHCLVHGVAMSASVVVGPTYRDSPVVQIHNNFFDSLAVHVRNGSYVKWVNVGSSHGVVND